MYGLKTENVWFENYCQAQYVASLDQDVLGSEVTSRKLALSRQQVMFFLFEFVGERQN
jgi:hypothetical protein